MVVCVWFCLRCCEIGCVVFCVVGLMQLLVVGCYYRFDYLIYGGCLWVLVDVDLLLLGCCGGWFGRFD